MKNPLLRKNKFPPFNEMRVEDIEPVLDTILTDNRQELEELLNQKNAFNWQNLMLPIENMDDRLEQMWSPVSHLNSVMNSAKLRDVYNRCLPKLTQYHIEISHNKKLYKAIRSIANSAKYKKYSAVQKKIIKDELRDFKLAGVTLSGTKKKRFADLQQQYVVLTTKFAENLLDATRDWYCHVVNKKQLCGLPQHVIDSARHEAKQKKLNGWVFTLDFPIFNAVMTYADDRKLRKKMYRAYCTRASEQKPSKRKFDNSQIMGEILKIRFELSNLLGFKNFAEYSLATKMAKNTSQVFVFLEELVGHAKPYAKKEFRILQKFAQQNYRVKKLEAWDIAYYSEKLRKEKFAITQEELRPYFMEKKVLNSMFQLVEKLFGLKIKEKKNKNVWHKDVKYFEILDQNKKLIGGFYTDLYARAHKRGGAWMDECRARRKLANNKIQTPLAYLTCNFSKPVKNKPSLLTHEEVCTLFHEFGHCLHHLLTKINYPEVSGINGVEWDAVELPSQFMENYCWQKEMLDLMTEHYKTHEKMPDEMFARLIASKNFHSGMQMVRQLEFALFDFKLHCDFNAKRKGQIQAVLDKVRKKVAVVPIPEFNRFQHSFAHIFAGGYAAGYYSYKWAEVLSSDTFAKFEENGVFNQKIGKQFLKSILAKGGSDSMMNMFKDFRGRKPNINALLRHSGLL